MFERQVSTSKTSQICPACDLLPLDKLTAKISTLYIFPVSLVLEELDFDSIEPFASRCDLCRLLTDLQNHWLVEESNVLLPYDGRIYWRPCGNSKSRLRYTDHSYLGLCVDFDSILAKRVEKRHCDADPLSSRSTLLVKHWMAKCERKHASCSGNTTLLPTRVIDVGDATSDKLRLVETTHQPGKYAALSHCWGTCRLFLTTRANLDDRKRGFIMDDLPATFRDAVRVAKALGLRFLWIDCVCIVQGDVADWEAESARMAGVYGDATLVIAAANAADDGEAFLKKRKEQYLPIDIRSTSGRKARIFILPAFNTDRSYPPLHNRAWTLQESYLATRLLLYNLADLQWECKQAIWHEQGKQNSQKKLSVQEVLPKQLENGELSYHDWYSLVGGYTTRAITYETDKLPALSGLATRVAQTSKDVYLAGIWKSDLARGLLWYRQVRRHFRPNESSAPFSHTGRKPERPVFIAPSWSWASFPGAISFTSSDPSIVDFKALQCTDYIDSQIKVPGQNPFGAVQWGRISIQAPILSLEYEEYDAGMNSSGVSELAAHRSWDYGLLFSPELENFDMGVLSSLDYPKEQLPQLRAIPLAFSTCVEGHFYAMEESNGVEGGLENNWHKVHGIIISAIPGEATLYERVGCFEMRP